MVKNKSDKAYEEAAARVNLLFREHDAGFIDSVGLYEGLSEIKERSILQEVWDDIDRFFSHFFEKFRKAKRR